MQNVQEKTDTLEEQEWDKKKTMMGDDIATPPGVNYNASSVAPSGSSNNRSHFSRSKAIRQEGIQDGRCYRRPSSSKHKIQASVAPSGLLEP